MTGETSAARRGPVDETRVPDVASAALRAGGAALLGAGIWTGLAGPIGLSWGLVAVAAFVGWLIGSATRSGAYGPQIAGGRSHPPIRGIAVAGALFAWILGLVGVYLYSLATIPDLPGLAQGSDLAERIRSISIVAFYAQQLGPLALLDSAVLLAAAWWSAR